MGPPMTPMEAAEILASAMNKIESAGFFLYPHPRPIGISIRIAKDNQIPDHPEKTRPVAQIWDQGDGHGWKARLPP